MTESGFEMPPDHIVFQTLSTLALSSPVIIEMSLLFGSGRGVFGIVAVGEMGDLAHGSVPEGKREVRGQSPLAQSLGVLRRQGRYALEGATGGVGCGGRAVRRLVAFSEP